MTTRSGSPTTPPRGDRRLRELVHDTYKSKSKLADPTHCTGCGAVYRKGRWQWTQAPPESETAHCPACLRIRDNYPAGTVRLQGKYLQQHKEELLNLVRNVEAREKADHPLKRVMAIEEGADHVLVSTTDGRLARGIGQALHDAHKGVLDFAYTKESELLRVKWER